MNDSLVEMAKEHREEMMQKCFFKNGRPSLHRSIIAFIDILGFKNLIAGGDAQGNLLKIYSTYLSSLKDIKDSVVIMKSFSDNILIVYPEISEGALGNSFFIALADFQTKLLADGIIIRGAITVGDIHVGEDIIFGNGLVEAYKLESDRAIVPRIIMSEGVIKLCQKYHQYYADESPFSRVLLKDADGNVFLNYLHNPYLGEGSQEYVEEVGKFLKIHKEIVEKRLEEFSSDIRVFDKYVWLGSYHNMFCDLHGFKVKIPTEKLVRKITTMKFK